MTEALIAVGFFLYSFAVIFTVRMLRLNGDPEDYKGVINLENEEDENV